MIDLHSHILPGIDDGSPDFETSLEMARIAAEDGTRVLACTPHFHPGVYDNRSGHVLDLIDELQHRVHDAGIDLKLVEGADAHIRPDFVAALKSGRILTLAGSHYVLVEPPHHIAPPRLDQLLFDILAAGYVPILTHPERLRWIEDHYHLVRRLSESGVWMQITGASFLGLFGRRARYWADRMLDEGRLDIVASDAHDTRRRVPSLWEARETIEDRLGQREIVDLFETRPLAVLRDQVVATATRGKTDSVAGQTPSLLRRIFGA